MKWSLLVSLVFLLTIITGCSEKSINSTTIQKPIHTKELNLSAEDTKTLEKLNQFIQEGTLVMKELEFLIGEFQKADALDEAFDAMIIAKEELELLLNKTVLLQPQNKEIQELANIVSEKIEPIIEGLNMQIKGIDHGDTELLQQGYQLTERYKSELYELEKVKD